MNQKNEIIGKKAGHYFDNGFHCAEAVAAAVLESFNENPSQAIAHATAFGGGIGRSFDEVCGAISGALIAIGHLHGRQTRGEEWDIPAAFAQKIRQKFIDQFKTTHCGTLRERFGEERQSRECSKLVEWVAQHLVEVLLNLCEKEIEPCFDKMDAVQ